MAFYKKILVLKQVAAGFSTDGKNVSGIARVEADGREATLYLTLLNLASAAEGDYGAYLVNREGAVFPFSTGKNPVSFSERITPYPDLSAVRLRNRAPQKRRAHTRRLPCDRGVSPPL